MSVYDPPRSFDDACGRLGLELEAAERDRLAAYLELLLETNKRFNLTAIKDPAEAWQRHILDSLSLLPFVAESRSVIDVGSGGGLPGIPLACVLPELPITLVEATGKKARFLATCASELGLGRVEVVTDRAETAGQGIKWRGRYDVAVARAVGPLNVLLELTMPFVRVGGRVLAMKGRRLDEELRDAGDALMVLGQGEIEVYEALPGLERDAVIVEVAKRAATPKQYPRRPGELKTNPL
ncbi:MAG: 16S rRNA (guanine(527)-N(7))-methyltransferase RsmG [Desulfobacterales bacterium]|nr:16S rRNA (guanine(527)-N(7))-methyltransferase RsmG [Desulfobacterales bacterium]